MKDKYSVTHMWNIKKVNKPNQTKANTDPKNISVVTREEGQRVGEMVRGVIW